MVKLFPLITLLAVTSVSAIAKPLGVGARLPDVTVRTEQGAEMKLPAALGSKPAVIIFYRGGWCPYCTKHLSAMMDIEEKLLAEGFLIFAISPDLPSVLAVTPDRKSLKYSLLSDSKMHASDAFGITFTVSDEILEKYKGYGIDLEAASGEKHHKLPHPAVFVVDQQGVIRFAHVNEDYKVRLEPAKVLAAARESKISPQEPTP